MLTSVRCGDDLTRSTTEDKKIGKAGGETTAHYLPYSNKSLTTCNGGGKLIESLQGSDQEAWGCPSAAVSKMARSAVSIFLFDGETNVFTCSGIPVERNLSYIRMLTSANLAMAMKTKSKLGSTMRIQVRDAFNNVAPGCLEHRELGHGTVFVRVTHFLDVCEVNLCHGVEFPPHNDLLAIRFTESGGVIPVKGVLTKGSSTSECDNVLCKAGDGGPLFDGDGNFVGMNLFLDEGRCAFMPRSVIVEQMEQFQKRNELRARIAFGSFGPICTRERRLRQENYVLI
ncbi:unnamed protein product [Urochloa humidicola]